jgi:hypothetical protein
MLGQTHGLRGLDINHKQNNVQLMTAVLLFSKNKRLMPAVYVEFQISILPHPKEDKVPPKNGHYRKYSLRPIILFTNVDVSRHILVIDTSVLAKSNIGRRE